MREQRRHIFKLKGIVKDIEPVELMNGSPPAKGLPTPNVWTAGLNVHFDDESTHRVGGYKGFADPMPPGAQPIFQLNVLTPATSYWIWVDGQTPGAPTLWVTDGTNHFDITPIAGLTGGEVGQWTGTVLNGVPVLNNNTDAPIWWNGATGTPMEIIPGWPPTMRCRSVRAYKYHLIAMDITLNSVEIQEQIRWSASADPGQIPAEWEATPSNDAGSAILAATPGGVVDGLKLRDNFIIYKQHSTYIMSYIAGQYVFSIRSLFTTTGIQALNCVQELRGRHWVFADDDVIVHDGNSFDSIVDNQVRDLLFDSINPDNHHLCHVAIRVPTDEIWIIAPTADSSRNSVALLYSFEDQVFGIRALPEVAFVTAGIVPREDVEITWDGSSTQWNTNIARWDDANYSATNDRLMMSAPGKGKLYNVDAAIDNDGEPIYAWVERTDWSLEGDPGTWTNNLYTSIFPTIVGADGDVVKIRIAGSKTAGGAIKWSPELDYVIGSGKLKLDAITHGRYFNIRISSDGGAPWQLHRIGVEYIPQAQF